MKIGCHNCKERLKPKPVTGLVMEEWCKPEPNVMVWVGEYIDRKELCPDCPIEEYQMYYKLKQL